MTYVELFLLIFKENDMQVLEIVLENIGFFESQKEFILSIQVEIE